MALHLALGFNFMTAAIYFLMPPVALLVIRFWWEKFPTFLVCTVIVAAVLTGLVIWAFKRRLSGLPWIAYLFLAPFPLVWIPIASGEIVRIAYMQTALARTDPECSETFSLISSLRYEGESAPAHARMIKHGRRYIWSYSLLRFVPESRPWLSKVRCD